MDGYLGVIKALGFQFTPRNWGYCVGALLEIDQYSALYSLLGDRFGGDARVTFGVPDLRGRSGIGQFQGPGLFPWVMGQFYGFENTRLFLSELPVHQHGHTYTGTGTEGDGAKIRVAKTHGTQQIPDTGSYIAMPSNNFGSAPEGNLYVTAPEATAAGTVKIGGVTDIGGGFEGASFAVNETGGQSLTPIMQPCQVVNYCICIDGLYPSRS
ncbi:tail fiber protein [Kordiimonas sp. SCSIO 12603]|uniref:phage tail protein n=1 Tax=Kordiimonas sp. SCSIO 12603 TaxID=2829596 RepID=UPI0021062A0E|nr:tail fiber protein [Kordiimonas sp. SCSIO 12603]UTW57845.1 tail fiber protein [Kordiimonas sp. SCSIO 12603]